MGGYPIHRVNSHSCMCSTMSSTCVSILFEKERLNLFHCVHKQSNQIIINVVEPFLLQQQINVISILKILVWKQSSNSFAHVKMWKLFRIFNFSIDFVKKRISEKFFQTNSFPDNWIKNFCLAGEIAASVLTIFG